MKRFIVALSMLSLVFAVMAVPVFANELDDHRYELPIITADGSVVLPEDFFNTTESTVPSVPADPEPGASGGSLISNVASIFGSVGSWIAGQLGTASSLFWNADVGALTFLGVLAVCALAFAVIFLIIVICSRFLCFRG